MTTINSSDPRFPDAGADSNQTIDPAVLASLAAEYFPEFSDAHPNNSTPSASLIDIVLPETAPVIDANENGLQEINPGDDSPFAFLADARPIFAAAVKSTELALLNQPIASGTALHDYSSGAVPLAVPTAANRTVFDVQSVRSDFPILSEKVNGHDLIWLDNAATTQKPIAVIERIKKFYEHENSNVHRAAHTLAARSTDAYEGARKKIAAYLNAASPGEIVFVRGATEGINLVAATWGAQNIGKDDEIILSHLEHHANIVPWQILAAKTGAKIRVIPVDDSGQILLSEYTGLLNPRTRLVAVTHVSNALGTVVPVAEIAALARKYSAKVLIDGAQSVAHMKVDVREIDADFFVLSGHKIFAPTGIGVLYGKEDLLSAMTPYQGGGNMIADVTFDKTVYQAAPAKFEAGTGNIADAVGLGAAIDYVNRLGIDNIAGYEHDLLDYTIEALCRIPGLTLIGTAREKAGVVSFILEGYTTEEVGKALSAEGIAVRAGHHCAQPILRRFGLESVVRPSLAFYNTFAEIDTLAGVIRNLSGRRHFR